MMFTMYPGPIFFFYFSPIPFFIATPRFLWYLHCLGNDLYVGIVFGTTKYDHEAMHSAFYMYGGNLFPSDRWALMHVELHFNMLYYSFIFIRLYVRNAQIYIIIIECL